MADKSKLLGFKIGDKVETTAGYYKIMRGYKSGVIESISINTPNDSQSIITFLSD